MWTSANLGVEVWANEVAVTGGNVLVATPHSPSALYSFTIGGH